jgi:hypothetical protein
MGLSAGFFLKYRLHPLLPFLLASLILPPKKLTKLLLRWSCRVLNTTAMRNPFAIEEDPQNPVPREAFGWRIYAVAFGATWVLCM